jgi:Zn-dependent membrane protease YugP
MISNISTHLNEQILGHFTLKHSSEDYSQFVESLDLTGNQNVDQALWAHHGSHDVGQVLMQDELIDVRDPLNKAFYSLMFLLAIATAGVNIFHANERH